MHSACYTASVPVFVRYLGSLRGLVLTAQVHAGDAVLQSRLAPALFDGADTRTVQDPAGDAVVTLPGLAFLLHYALPNFFFHVTTAYAILRNHGVPLGKEDFDTFHRYA